MRIGKVISILLALSAAGAWAQVPADGIYDVVLSGGTIVKTVDGASIHLGARLSPTPYAPSLVSMSNDNEYYSLRLYLRNIGLVALCGGGFCEDFNSAYENEISIPSSQAAMAYAKYLGIQPKLRADPSCKLALRFIPEKAIFTDMDPVRVRLEIENVGQVAAAFRVGTARSPLGLTESGPKGTVVDISNPFVGGGLRGITTLKPGEIYHRDVMLRSWFDISEPGVYRLQGRFTLDFIDSLQMLDPFWVEVATAEFSINIQ